MKTCDRRAPAVAAFAVAFLFFAAGEAWTDDASRLAEYRLTDDGLATFTQASRNLAMALKADPGLEDSMEATDNTSIEEMAAFYDSNPVVRKAIESADMTSSEYVTFMYSMIQAGMAASMIEEHGQTELPAGTPQENVDYYRANKDKFTALFQELQAVDGAEESE